MTKKIEELDKKYEEELENIKEDQRTQIATLVQEAVHEAEGRLRAALPQADQQALLPERSQKEYDDRQNRKRNLMIYGAEEAGGDIQGKDRQDFDIDLVRDLFEAIQAGICNTDLKKIRRVGPFKEGQERPRPLQLIFETAQQRDEVYVKGRTLNTRTDHMQNYRMAPDLTLQQRQAYREAKRACDEKNRHRTVPEMDQFMWKPRGESGYEVPTKVLLKPREKDGDDDDWKQRTLSRYEKK